jgi:hydrogenase expression/formation protein HypE
MNSKMSKESAVRLVHGDGSLATLRFIRKKILSRFGNPILNNLEDGCQIDIRSNQIIVSTDSYIVDPIIFPGGDIGKLSVTGTVNDLLASGAIPQYITLNLILAEGLEMAILDQILDSIKMTADSASVKIVAGDTKVINSNTQIEIIISTTGIGIPAREGVDYSVSKANVGDDIIVTGTIGDHSLSILSLREGLGYEQRISSDCAALDKLILPLIENFNGIKCMRDPTRGGITGVLCDMSEGSSVDLHIDRTKIPIKNEVSYGCEMLGIDPLSLVNEGKMVMVVDPYQTNDILKVLRKNVLGIDSAVIGKVQKKENTVASVILKNGHTSTLLQRPEGAPIPRLC